ncbi:class F sortase [Streptomyces sudanensis]|uniref:class F sortase n=1 Tax=Streptomyces sudanensis TaxID=436397 RepID=UPI0020CC46A9|nr:class F sortase [Streptomyces sudanensis]MCP9985396.1 class F sortase [Streptomyces sudanensis]
MCARAHGARWGAADTARQVTGFAAVTAAALAAVLAPAAAPSRHASAPSGFGRAAAADTATPAAPSEPAPPVRAPAPPVRVLVPGVGLDAPVRPVGVTGAGDLAVPADPAVAGWYRFGPAPGGPRGSSVLVGHVDDGTGALGEFAALRDVAAGDSVEVRRAGSTPVRYRVTARSTVPKDALPARVFRRSGPPVLTLVTCAPPFVPEAGGYQANLIATAEPADT